MQSAIQLPQQEFASDCKEENTLADRADLMAELEIVSTRPGDAGASWRPAHFAEPPEGACRVPLT